MLKTFLEASPAFVLRMFACDCAERLFWRERMRGNEPNADCWLALECVRTGQKVKPDLDEQAKRSFEALSHYSSYDYGDERQRPQHRACHRAAWALTMSDPQHAAQLAASALQALGEEHEQQWALARISWLGATYQWAGERMAFLLPEGEIDTPTPIQIR